MHASAGLPWDSGRIVPLSSHLLHPLSASPGTRPLLYLQSQDWDLNVPGQDVPLWHRDYFQLKANSRLCLPPFCLKAGHAFPCIKMPLTPTGWPRHLPQQSSGTMNFPASFTQLATPSPHTLSSSSYFSAISYPLLKGYINPSPSTSLDFHIKNINI